MGQGNCLLDLQFYFRGAVLLRCLHALGSLLLPALWHRLLLAGRLWLLQRRTPPSPERESPRHQAYHLLNQSIRRQMTKQPPSPSHPDLDHLVYHYYDFAFNFAIVLAFGACMPSAMFLFLLVEVLFIQVTKRNLTHLYRRARPQLASSIGQWVPLMEVVSLLAIPLNAMYLTHSLSYYSARYSDLVLIKHYRMQFFGLFSLFLFSLKFLFSLFNAQGA